MNFITELFKIDFTTFVLSLFAIVFAVKEIIELVSYFKNKYRIKFGSEQDKETIESRIYKLEQHDKFQYDKLNDLSKGIQDIKNGLLIIEENSARIERENDLRRIKDLKSEILAYARSLKRFESDNMEDDFDADDYDHIFECFQGYEDLLLKYKMKNGKTLRAMGYINKHSDKHGYGTVKI